MVIGPRHLKLLDIDIDNLDNVRDEVRVTSADGASTQCLGTIHTILYRCGESTSEMMCMCNGVQTACLAYQRLQDLHWCLCEKQTTGTTTHSVWVLDVNPDTDPSPELRKPGHCRPCG